MACNRNVEALKWTTVQAHGADSMVELPPSPFLCGPPQVTRPMYVFELNALNTKVQQEGREV